MKAKSSYLNALQGSLKARALADAVTARMDRRNNIVIEKHPAPSYTRTAAQDAQRTLYAEACAKWHTLTEEEKAAYAAEAKRRKITVFNAFLSNYLTAAPPAFDYAILIDNSLNPNTLTDFQIPLNVTADSDFFAALNNDHTHMEIYDSDQATLLPFYVEKWDAVNYDAITWIKVPEIPGSSTKTIYLKANLDRTTPLSDADATFARWDAMENTNAWIEERNGGSIIPDTTHVYEGTYAIKIFDDGSWNVNNDYYARLRRTDVLDGSYAYIIQFYDTNLTTAHQRQIFLVDDGTNPVMLGVSTDQNTSNYIYRFGGTFYASGVSRSEGWHEFTIIWDGANYILKIDGQDVASQSGYGAPARIVIGSFWDWENSTFWYDAFRVRKYTDPEPTVSYSKL